MSSGLYSIEKLDDGNYDAWKVQMRSVLVHCELWTYVSTPTRPDGISEDIWNAKDEKALATITLSVKTPQIIHIKRCKTSSEAWKKLEAVHQPTGPARKVTVFKQLLNLKMAEGSLIVTHLNSFYDLFEKLCEIDIKLPDELFVIILLSSLPKSYENFVVAIESRDELPKSNVIKTKLLEEGSRRESEAVEANGGESAFFSRHKRPTQTNSQSQQHTQRQRRVNSNAKCYKCHRKGHYAATCTVDSSKSNEAFAMLNATGAAEISANVWVLDSGTTCHMCCDKKMFEAIISHREKIHLAGDNCIYSAGIGEVVLHTPTSTIRLRDVLFIPSLKTNFLSMSKATECGYIVKFDNIGANIINESGKTVMSADKCGSLFLYTPANQLNSMIPADSLFTKWHERYGHLNVRSLINLSRSEMVRGLILKNYPNNIDCETCIKGKICSLPFGQNNSIKSSAVLELVHSDICGPMRTTSLGGFKYFALFIDDFSRKIFVHFLKKKSDIFEVFKTFKNRVERETGNQIKVLRTDNGCEYVSGEFNKFLDKEGIRRNLTVQYTPQQNGVAERANRTIFEMARCMLLSSNLPESLWGEAINTAVYLKNRSPTKLLLSTPYEAWCGTKPAVHHLRIFGCKAFALDKRQGKSKFAARGVECVMVGYSPESKAYRLYNPHSRTIIKSRDVRFIESSSNIPSDYLFVEPGTAENHSESNQRAVKADLDSEDDVEFDDAISHPVGDGSADIGSDMDNADAIGDGTLDSGAVVVVGAVGEADRGAVGGAIGGGDGVVGGTACGEIDDGGTSSKSHRFNLRPRPPQTNSLYMAGDCVTNNSPVTVAEALA